MNQADLESLAEDLEEWLKIIFKTEPVAEWDGGSPEDSGINYVGDAVYRVLKVRDFYVFISEDPIEGYNSIRVYDNLLKIAKLFVSDIRDYESLKDDENFLMEYSFYPDRFYNLEETSAQIDDHSDLSSSQIETRTLRNLFEDPPEMLWERAFYN